jgi:hypothetical protein
MYFDFFAPTWQAREFKKEGRYKGREEEVASRIVN